MRKAATQGLVPGNLLRCALPDSLNLNQGAKQQCRLYIFLRRLI